MEEEKILENWNTFKTLLLETKRPNIENLIKWLDDSDFKYAPASTQYHNSFKGGLLQHSLNVYNAMKDFQHWIDFFELSEESIRITALLHDICKVNCYSVSMRNTKNENGDWVKVPYYIWEEQEPLGHGAKSVMLINEYGVQLDKVERAMIVNHMGFTSNDDERRVSRLFRICPQSLLLHCADLEATMILESFDGPPIYINKIKDKKNIKECLENKNIPEYIQVDNMKYQVAPHDAIVDDREIIEVVKDGVKIKVYSPYGDGLPF